MVVVVGRQVPVGRQVEVAVGRQGLELRSLVVQVVQEVLPRR